MPMQPNTYVVVKDQRDGVIAEFLLPTAGRVWRPASRSSQSCPPGAPRTMTSITAEQSPCPQPSGLAPTLTPRRPQSTLTPTPFPVLWSHIPQLPLPPVMTHIPELPLPPVMTRIPQLPLPPIMTHIPQLPLPPVMTHIPQLPLPPVMTHIPQLPLPPVMTHTSSFFTSRTGSYVTTYMEENTLSNTLTDC